MAETQKRFDPTIRLDFLLAFAMLLGGGLLFAGGQNARLDALESDSRSTAEILADIKAQVDANRSWIDHHEGYEAGVQAAEGRRDG